MTRPLRERRWWTANALPVGGVAAGMLLAWQCTIWAFGLPAILLPSPAAVVQEAWAVRGELLTGSLVSFSAALAGLLTSLAVGTLVGIAFSQSRSLRIGFFPYVMFLQTVPIIGIAPLLITWSGYQFRTVVLISAIISLFPIINSVTSGLLAIDPHLEDLFRLYGAGRGPLLWKLRFPTAVRFLLLGAKTSSGLAVIGAIVGDFFVGNGSADYLGLGTLMTRWMAWQNTRALLASMFASALIGLLMYALVNLIARLLSRWATPGTHGSRGRAPNP